MCVGILLEATCCAGKSFCDTCCQCCSAAFGLKPSQRMKLSYIVFNFFFMASSIIILFYAQKIVEPFSMFVECPVEAGGNLNCFGISAVYRMSFVLGVFHLFMLMFCLLRSEISKIANEGAWFLKIFAIPALFVSMMYIPNSFFMGYVDFARVVSILFLIFESIVFIDLFYHWGERWVKNYDDGHTEWQYILILTAVGLYIGTFAFIGQNFVYFGGTQNTTINVINVILVIVMTVLSISGLIQNGSLITSGAICIYVTYFNFLGMSSNPEPSNNILFGSDYMISFSILTGIFIIFTAIIYLAFFHSGPVAYQDPNEEKQGLDYENLNSNRKEVLIEDSIDIAIYKTNTYVWFHAIMTIGSMYFSMFLTNWSDPDLNQQFYNTFQPNWTSYWTQIASSWIASLLYIWTIIAPSILTDRKF